MSYAKKTNFATRNRKEVVRKPMQVYLAYENLELMMSEHCEGRRALL
jgi:hypothetical protein